MNDSKISDNDYAANFAAFLDARAPRQPFCFWYGAREPHRAYEYDVGVSEDGRRPSDIDAVPEYWPDTESVRTDMLDYAFEIGYFDLHLRRMLALLEEDELPLVAGRPLPIAEDEERGVDVLGFYYQTTLPDETHLNGTLYQGDLELLRGNGIPPDQLEGNERTEYGGNLDLRLGGFALFAQYVKEESANLPRTGFEVEASCRFVIGDLGDPTAL